MEKKEVKFEKLTFENIKNELSREEMKQIMAGSGPLGDPPGMPPGCYYIGSYMYCDRPW